MTPSQQPEALMALIEELEYAVLGFQRAGNFDRVHKAKAALLAALTSHAGADGWLPIEQVVPVKCKRMLLVVDCGPGTDAWVRTGYSFPGDKDWFSDELQHKSMASYGYRVTHAREMPAPPAPEALEVKRV